MVVKYEDYDLADYIEQVTKRYVIRTQDSQYVNVDRGEFVREGLGKLSFDLRGHITSEASLDTLRKAFLENSSDYKKFYYPNDDKFWKVKTKRFDVEERGGILNYYPVSIRLETLDQFQYAESTTVTTGTALATASHLELDGSTSYVAVPDSAELNPGTITIQGYFLISEAQDSYLIDKWDSDYKGYVLQLTDGTPRLALGDGNLGNILALTATTSVVDGSWHHLAGVFDGATAYIYIDGTENISTAWAHTLASASKNLYFGAMAGNLFFFEGSMDEIRVSNQAKDVGGLGSKPFSVEADTVGLWHFDDISGTVASDSGTYNNDGSVADCTWQGDVSAGSLDISLVNDGNIWCKPELRVVPVGGNLASPSFGNNNGATITWEGTISQGGTLFIYPDRTARIEGVWYSGLLEGTYPKIEVLDGGTEDWVYSHPSQSCTEASISLIHRDRYW